MYFYKTKGDLMKYLRIFALALLTAFLPLAAQTATLEAPASVSAESSWKDVVDYARQNLPLEGQLIVKSDGFGYLKVDDAYIHTLLPMLGLQGEGYTEPPYFRSADSPGAHVSVFYVDEHTIPAEVGQTIPFELDQIVIVKPTKTTSYAVLQVRSPELEKLREKYGLSPKLHGHEYHISIGKKVEKFPK